MLLTTFVVPPLGGIEAATKPQVPVKTGTTNGDCPNHLGYAVVFCFNTVTRRPSIFT